MIKLLCLLTLLYVIAIFGRVILSWFPVSHDSPVAVVGSVLYRVTEPVLAPVRRLMPPVRVGAMMIDLSLIVVLLTLHLIVRGVLLQCG